MVRVDYIGRFEETKVGQNVGDSRTKNHEKGKGVEYMLINSIYFYFYRRSILDLKTLILMEKCVCFCMVTTTLYS